MERIKIQDSCVANIIRNRQLADQLDPMGWFSFEINGKKVDFSNLVVNEGKNNLLNVMFKGGTQTAEASWFLGLISTSGFTSIQAADTAASHAGWSEFTGYSQSTRVAWGQGTVASQALTNASPATFSINAAGTLRGAFLITNSTKGGTTGILWSAGQFVSTIPVDNGDEIRVTYNLAT